MRKRQTAALLLLVASLVAACGADNWQESLSYAGPLEIAVERGAFLAGTDIQYLGESPDGAQVLIGDQQATKKIGDSLHWDGEMAPGVTVNLSLRIVFVGEDSLQTAGTVRVTLTDVQPVVGTVDTEVPVHYVLPVAYRVDQGAAIPGTTITYLGQDPEGARLGNVEGYPYRRVGDSILWEGELLPGVWLDLVARTALIADRHLDVVGTADLWIEPQQ